jgi:DNA-binding IclR family transcriptional regulator
VGVSGLMLLASLPLAEAQQVVHRNAQRLKAMQIDPQDLLQRAKIARQRDYAFAPIGVVPGSRAVAVPVRSPEGQTIAGIAVATITERMPDSRVPEVVRTMTAQAAGITARLAEVAQSRRGR